MEMKDYSFYVAGMTEERFTEIALTSIPAKDFPEYWESPYFYDGITIGELEEEVRHYADSYEDYKKGAYTPLWKQRLTALQILKYKNPMLTIEQFYNQNSVGLLNV